MWFKHFQDLSRPDVISRLDVTCGTSTTAPLNLAAVRLATFSTLAQRTTDTLLAFGALAAVGGAPALGLVLTVHSQGMCCSWRWSVNTDGKCPSKLLTTSVPVHQISLILLHIMPTIKHHSFLYNLAVTFPYIPKVDISHPY